MQDLELEKQIQDQLEVQKLKEDVQKIQDNQMNPETLLQIFRGKRPEGMDYKVYKAIQAELKNANKQYLKGKFAHNSNFIVRDNPETGKQEYGILTKGVTYYKPKEEETKNV